MHQLTTGDILCSTHPVERRYNGDTTPCGTFYRQEMAAYIERWGYRPECSDCAAASAAA